MLNKHDSAAQETTANNLPHEVYLALGSNLGDRRANLQAALDRLRAGGHLQVRQISRLYETAPFGYADQPAFLNMALIAQTDLEPLTLLDYLKEVEAALGREPQTVRNGPRPLDLDIIFYDDRVLDEERLQIPHPRLRGRSFVLVPLAELCHHKLHPDLNLTVAQLLAEADTTGIELYREEEGLEIPGPRFLFLTGTLAEGWLQDFLGDLGRKLGFEYRIATLNIEVAAFMTCRFVADRLLLSETERQQLNGLILPGFAGGELALVAQASGLQVQRGPTDLLALEPFLAGQVAAHTKQPEITQVEDDLPLYPSEGQLRAMQSRLTDPNIRIYTDGQRVFAFNNAAFGVAAPDERELRSLFRLLKVDNAAHAYYLGREFNKAAISIKLGRPYRQDRDIELN